MKFSLVRKPAKVKSDTRSDIVRNNNRSPL
jgi:hypothetical protein